jgi:hypothetical protein
VLLLKLQALSPAALEEFTVERHLPCNIVHYAMIMMHEVCHEVKWSYETVQLLRESHKILSSQFFIEQRAADYASVASQSDRSCDF